MSDDRSREFQIAVNEVATNTIVHTDGLEPFGCGDDEAVVAR